MPAFQVGVQRPTVVRQVERGDSLTGPDGLERWQVSTGALSTIPETAFDTDDDGRHEIRNVAAGEGVRLAWRSPGRASLTVLQLAR